MMCGCADRTFWDLRNVPTTEAERKAVAEMTEAIMRATPTTLAGRDQDWDDAIEMANKKAMETLCQPTLWRRIEFQTTGEWKYAKEIK